GTAGDAADIRATQHRLSVGIIERDKLGGVYLHYGCIPTIAYLHAAEVADSARASEKFGVKATFESIDMAAVRDYKDKIVDGKFKGLQGLLKMRKVTTISGNGRLVSENQIDVNGTDYTGKHIILASGAGSNTMGLTISDKILTSTDALQLDYTPKSALVLGGGVIGSEFASAWNSCGMDVTIIEGLDTL